MKSTNRILPLAILLLLFIHNTVYADETPPPKMQEGLHCEGETAKLSCPNGTVISIQLANYGRFSVIPCNPSGDDTVSVSCHNDKTVEILKNRCQNQRECEAEVLNTFFGDACPESSKYLEVKYICVPPTATTTTTTTTPIPITTATASSTTPANGIEKPSLTSALPTSAPKFCESVYARHIRWPKTESGSIARVKCPVETHGEAEWFCSIEGKWEPSTGADLSGCISTWSKKLEDDVETSPDDSLIQLETLKEIHGHTRREQLIGGELIKIATIVKKVVHNYVNIMRSTVASKESHSTSMDMNKFLVETINLLLSTHQDEAWLDINPTKQRDVASILLDSSEKLLASLFPVTASTSPESSSDNFVAKPHIKAQVSTVSIYDYVSFPAIPMTNDIVHIPKEALEVSGGHNAQVVYSNYDGFQKYLQPQNIEASEFHKKLVSRILTISIVRHGRPQPIHRIARPAVLSFHTQVSPNLTNPQCVWWDSSIRDWSTNGCSLKSHNGSITICECSHLTHFAILMDVKGIQLPAFHEMALTIITYVGCLLSIICLLLSFIAFFIFGDSSCDRNSIHMNLSFTLAIAEFVFLFGIYRTDDKLTCSIVGAVLQYFFLSAFCWMSLEGLQLYFMLVQVFSSKRSRKPFFYIIAYGFPAIVSACSFYWNPQGFGTNRHCWLSTDNYFILTFVGPAAFILFWNLLFLLMTFCIVCKHSNVGYKPCKHDFDTIKMVRAWLKGSFALVFLLGLTWCTGFFWIDQKTVWVAYVFTVLNTLQGVFIFVFHIWLNDKMHIDYENWVRRNDWLPGCLRDPALNVHERRTGPYVPSTATSSAHCGTSDSSNGSDGMNSQTFPRKSRGYRPQSRTHYEVNNDSSIDPLLYTGQCPNCSHSTTILYSASNTLRGEYSENPLPETPDEPFYSPTSRKNKRTPLSAINFPGQQWTLDRFGNPPSHGERKLYNASLKEAMSNYHQHRMPDETYDYATIPYDSNFQQPSNQSPTINSYRPNYGVDLYPVTIPSNSQYPRPPPNFKPPQPPLKPPPPQITSIPVSDDSAYSDSGASSSRSPNSIVSRNGTMLLRMDLTKNPPVFCEDV